MHGFEFIIWFISMSFLSSHSKQQNSTKGQRQCAIFVMRPEMSMDKSNSTQKNHALIVLLHVMASVNAHMSWFECNITGMCWLERTNCIIDVHLHLIYSMMIICSQTNNFNFPCRTKERKQGTGTTISRFAIKAERDLRRLQLVIIHYKRQLLSRVPCNIWETSLQSCQIHM